MNLEKLNCNVFTKSETFFGCMPKATTENWFTFWSGGGLVSLPREQILKIEFYEPEDE
jgi:hypothetical protein